MTDQSGFPRYRWAVLAALLVGSATFAVHLIFMAPILPEIAKNLNIDMGSAANLFTIYVLAGSIAMTFGGFVCDKFGITTALVLGHLCASVPAVLMPWLGTSYGAVVTMRLIQGLSTGFFVTTTGPVLALWFPPEERGLAGGLATGALSVGYALTVVLAPMIFKSTGSWQMTSVIISVVGWVGIVVALLCTRRTPPVLQNQGAMVDMPQVATMTFADIVKSPVTWIGLFCVFFGNWGLQPLMNYVPAYLSAPAPTGVGFGPLVAGRLALATTIVGIFSTSTGGLFFDKVAKGDPRLPIALGFCILGVFAYALLCPFVYGNMFLLILCLMLAGWGAMFIYPAINAYVIGNFPPNMAGTMIGVCFGLGGFGGTIGLYLGSLTISKSGNFNMAIMLISLASIAGVVVGILTKQRARG